MARSYLSLTLAVMSVRMMPGLTSKTETPSSARRSASSLVSMASPALEMQYSLRSGVAISALTEPMLTMLRRKPSPRGCAAIHLATHWLRKNVPRRLTPMTRSKASGVVASISPRLGHTTPALLISMSNPPPQSATLSTNGLWASRSARSLWT